MTLTTLTVLDDTNIKRDGTIILRFAKQVMNCDAVISTEWHRTSIAPGCDVDGTLSLNSQQLVQLGYSAISYDDVTKIKQIVSATQTADVVAAYQAAIDVQP